MLDAKLIILFEIDAFKRENRTIYLPYPSRQPAQTHLLSKQKKGASPQGRPSVNSE